MRRLIFLFLILGMSANCLALQKNVASQKWTIFAFDRTDNTAKTGDLSQITGSIWIDGVENVIGDTNPTELAHGYYEFDIDQAETNGDYLVMDAVSSTGNIQVVGTPMAVWTTAPAINTLSIANARVNVDITAISTDTTAADNLELQYDGTGIIGDNFPFTQSEGAAIGGGLAINTTMASVTVIGGKGSEQDLANAATSDDSWWTGDDDGSGAEFNFRCTPADTESVPVEVMFEGYYDEPSGSSNGATLQVYNFNSASWNTIVALTNSGSDEDHEVPLSHAHRAPGGGTLETVVYTIGDVLIKFFQDTTETGNACLLIDHMVVGFVGSLVTATEIVDEWESQANSDPTGFKVNVMEVNGTGQTANDMSGDIDTIATAVGNIETDTAAQDTAGEWDTLMATVDGKLDTAQTDLDTITGTAGALIATDAQDLSGSLSVNTKTITAGAITGAAIATDAIDADAMKTDAWTELLTIPFIDIGAGAPPYNAGWFLGLNYLFEAWRNVTTTGPDGAETEITIFKNDGTTPLVESVVSDDDTTFTRGEMGAPD